jgi:hypothetical protein
MIVGLSLHFTVDTHAADRNDSYYPPFRRPKNCHTENIHNYREVECVRVASDNQRS